MARGVGADLAEAERSARVLIEAAPNREVGHMLLMQALVARGRRPEAVHVYERLRERLRALLGIEPGPELQSLRADLATEASRNGIGAGDKQVGAPAAQKRSPLPSWLTSEHGSFVGRGAELRQLREQWVQARSGERRLVLIRGEAGMGKTRLAVEFALSAQRGDARILYGRCDEDTVVNYQPFVESLRHYLLTCPIEELEGELASHLPQLVRLVPELSQRLPQIAGEGVNEEEDRYPLFEAVDATLGVAAATTPTLLVLDDVHWADRDTLLLLRHLVRSPRRYPLLILGTYRSTAPGDPLGETLADLGRDRLLERIALEGLDERESASMISPRRPRAGRGLRPRAARRDGRQPLRNPGHGPAPGRIRAAARRRGGVEHRPRPARRRCAGGPPRPDRAPPLPP